MRYRQTLESGHVSGGACWKLSSSELILLSDEAKCLGTPDSSTSHYNILLTFLDPGSLTRSKLTLSPSSLESLMPWKCVKCLAWRGRKLFSAWGHTLSHLGPRYNSFLCNELFYYHCGAENIPVTS